MVGFQMHTQNKVEMRGRIGLLLIPFCRQWKLRLDLRLLGLQTQ
jgi:hypothetical protein